MKKIEKLGKEKSLQKSKRIYLMKMLSTLQILNLVNISSLLKKGPSFIPTPKDINWFNLRQDFDKFTNQLRIKFNQVNDKSTVKSQTSTPVLAVITSRIIPMNKNQKRNTRVTTFIDLKRPKMKI